MKEGGNYVVANGKESYNLGEMDQDYVDTDDSKDSDAVQLFELPKRKLVRPLSSSLRRKVRPPNNQCWKTTKECCRVFVTVTLPMLIAVFIVSTILCLTFLLVGIAGMKQEISVLKIKLKNVDAAEKNFVGKKEQLRRHFQDKLNDIVSYQSELLQMKNSVRELSSRVNQLNATVQSLHHKQTSPVSSKLAVLKHDIDTLKNGMADTGADIEKLKATGKQLTKDVGSLSGEMNKANHKMYNISVQISQLENKPPPPLTTTPKTLVVTLTPDQNQPPSRKEVKDLLAASEKKELESCRKEVSKYDVKLEELRNYTSYMNKTYSSDITYLRHYLTASQKMTDKPRLTTPNTLQMVNSTGNQTNVKPSSLPPPHTLVHDATVNETSTVKTTASSNGTQTKESRINTTLPTTTVMTNQLNATQYKSHLKSKRFDDIKAEKIIDKLKTKSQSGSNINRKTQDLNRSMTNKKLDKLDAGNPT